MYDDLYQDGELNTSNYQDYTMQDALNALPLREGTRIIPAQVVEGFSDISPEERAQLSPFWQSLPSAQRLLIMERLAEASEADYALDYSEFAKLGYTDPDASVRAASINTGWADEDPRTIQTLMELARDDSSDSVRAAALIQLGRFIHMGEVEEMSKTYTSPAEELALNLYLDPQQPLEVQRRALEAVSQCSRPGINELVSEAYQHPNPLMRHSAVNAMGNTCDNVWEATILKELESSDEAMRFEAVRAAGLLSMRSAVKLLGAFAINGEDRQIQEAAVWSLGEIGSDKALDILNRLYEVAEANEDEALMEAIDEAMSMGEMMAGMGSELEMLVYGDDGAGLDDYGDTDSFEDEDY